MKIDDVKANNRRRGFEVRVRGKGVLFFPYARLPHAPEPGNRVVDVYADPELGHEGLTYRLEDGTEDSMRIPVNPSTSSGGIRPPVPAQAVHPSERSDAGRVRLRLSGLRIGVSSFAETLLSR